MVGLSPTELMPCPVHYLKTTLKRRGFLCGYKTLLPARKGLHFYLFFLLAFSCLYACWCGSENGFAYSFTLILSIAISCISCSRIYFATVVSFNPTVLT